MPRIEMAGNDHDLLRMLGALEVCDDVIAGHVRKLLRSEREVEAHLALCGEVGHEGGVFGADSSGGNAGGITGAGVGQAKIRAAYGTNEGADSAHLRCCLGTGSAVAYGFAVGDEG